MSKTFVWGHRGAGFIGTQNSPSSFKKAIEIGVDGFKTEAQLSKDHEIFLTFQQNLKINGEEIPIYELSSDEIKTFKLDNNESILTLSELFNEYSIFTEGLKGLGYGSSNSKFSGRFSLLVIELIDESISASKAKDPILSLAFS